MRSRRRVETGYHELGACVPVFRPQMGLPEDGQNGLRPVDDGKGDGKGIRSGLGNRREMLANVVHKEAGTARADDQVSDGRSLRTAVAYEREIEPTRCKVTPPG